MPRPMDNFLCPYCFESINHESVHFRSARVDLDPSGILPDDFDPYDDGDVQRFITRYNGNDKESRLQRFVEWKHFSPREDEQYETFWRWHGGTKTEVDPLKKFSHIDSWLRPIINPNRVADRKFLRTQADGGVFVRDYDGMVARVELEDGKKCPDRVCPYCHNPLPIDYGKYPIKFVSVIGITGSGKTVYLSQLLKKMDDYAVKVGLSAGVKSAASRKFYSEDNVIAVDVSLPAPTPAESFQQPLFYDLRRTVNGKVRTDTFVLYDVAGEVFEDQSLIAEFAPFIEHSDGLIMLVDPGGLRATSKVTGEVESMIRSNKVLDEVQNIVHQGSGNAKCRKPFAICITKTDMPIVQEILPSEMQDLLLDDVHKVVDATGRAKPAFNATEYAPIAKNLNEFIKTTEEAFEMKLYTNYTTYAFFCFTALGCEVKEGTPVGPILPKRIEEPLLWLFYELGFIGMEGTYPIPNPQPVVCPNCNSAETVELTGADRFYTTGRIIKKRHEANRKCLKCGTMWMREEDQ